MALTEQSVIDRIEVLENGSMQIRQADNVLKNGEIVATNFTRWVIYPGDDVSNQDSRIQDVASVIWTQKIIDEYNAKKSAGISKMIENI